MSTVRYIATRKVGLGLRDALKPWGIAQTWENEAWPLWTRQDRPPSADRHALSDHLPTNLPLLPRKG